MAAGGERSSTESLFSAVCKIHPDRKITYGVTVTRTDISFLQITSSTKKAIQIQTSDIIGCEITTQGDQQILSEIDEHSACISIYVYELKNSKSKVVTGRRRRVITVIFDGKGSYRENRDDAVSFHQKVLATSSTTGTTEWREKKALILVNPKSGSGKALRIFQQKVSAMFAEAGVQFSLIVTQKAGHAEEMMRDLDLSKWYGIIIVSGDGLIYEVVNGLKQHQDPKKALKMPIGCLPGGSGNALSAAICYAAGESVLDNIITNASYILLKHQVLPIDFMALEMQSGQKLYSFLSVTWGFIADVDIESEKYRFMGGARMTLGTLIRTVNLRKYRGRLSFLPLQPYVAPMKKTRYHRSESLYPTNTADIDRFATLKKASSTVSEPIKEENDTEGASNTDEPVTFETEVSEDVIDNVPNGINSDDHFSSLPPLDQPVPSNWVTLEREFVTVGVISLSHLGTDLIVNKDRTLTEGSMDLVILNHGLTRAKLIKTFIEMAEGKVEPSVDVERIPVTAFRLEPLTDKGILAVDGEKVDYGPIQGQIIPAMGRVMAKEK